MVIIWWTAALLSTQVDIIGGWVARLCIYMFLYGNHSLWVVLTHSQIPKTATLSAKQQQKVANLGES